MMRMVGRSSSLQRIDNSSLESECWQTAEMSLFGRKPRELLVGHMKGTMVR